MYARIKNDFDAGIEKIKWFSRLLSERVRIEMVVFRLSCQSEELKKKRDTLMRSIGEEVYLMRKGEKGIYANRQILDTLSEIEALEPSIKETDDRMTEINRLS
jgi:hypothetical protein